MLHWTDIDQNLSFLHNSTYFLIHALFSLPNFNISLIPSLRKSSFLAIGDQKLKTYYSHWMYLFSWTRRLIDHLEYFAERKYIEDENLKMIRR